MLSAVEIIIERAKTNPEEFYDNTKRISAWINVIEYYRGCLTKEEDEALDEALNNAKREMFTHIVMQKLTGVEKERDDDQYETASGNRVNQLAKAMKYTVDAKVMEELWNKGAVVKPALTKVHDDATDASKYVFVNMEKNNV